MPNCARNIPRRGSGQFSTFPGAGSRTGPTPKSRSPSHETAGSHFVHNSGRSIHEISPLRIVNAHLRRAGGDLRFVRQGRRWQWATERGQAARTTTSNDLTKVGELGSIEVVAKLLEVPEGAIFKRDLYDYATVLKYQVIEVHRGKVDSKTIFVGHYNPFKPRSESADGRVKRRGRSQGIPRRAGPSDGAGSTDRRPFHGRDREQVLRTVLRSDLLGGVDQHGRRLTRTVCWEARAPLAAEFHGLHHLSLRLLLPAAGAPCLLRAPRARDRATGALMGAVSLALNAFLLAASYVFYGWWNPWFMLLMLGVTVVNFVCGRLIGLRGGQSANAVSWASRPRS